MSDKKINLEEFLCNHGVDGYKDSFKIILLEFGKQLLELAAENAKLMDNGRVLSSNRYTIEAHDVYYVETEIEVSKQSILDIIKQIE